MSMKT